MTEAEDAARHWGAALIRPLRLRENEVHEIALAGNIRAALRLHRVGYQSAVGIRSELWWCAELARAGLPVPRPLPAADGALLVRLTSGRFASVVSWIDGLPFGEAGVPLAGAPAALAARHEALGALIAQMHLATDALTLPADFSRPSWDRDGLTGEAPHWERFWDHPALRPDEAAALQEARDWLRARLAVTASPLGLIHADVLRENILVGAEGALSLIDFDDSGFGFRWFDLGTVLSQDLYEPAYPHLRAALIAGYARHLPLDPAEVDTFTLARTLASVGWAMTRLPAGHPVHRSHIDRAVMMARRCLP